MSNMERRAFFKLAGLSAAALAAGGALSSCDQAALPDTPLTPAVDADGAADGAVVVGEPFVSFSVETDVLVVGSGVAGLSAAMAPAEAGRAVAVYDKLDLLGGESYDSNGLLRVAGSAAQKAAGVDASPADVWEERKQQLTDEGVEDLEFAKRLFEATPDWANHLADEYGVQFEDPKDYEADGVNRTVLLPKKGLGDMESIMVPLRDGLSGKGVAFATGQRAVAFILSEGGTVCGVRFRSAEGTAVTDVHARCVVVATGGFASSQPLVHAYTPDWERVGCYTVASMGEGQQLCEAVGGQLTGMDKAAPLTSDLPLASVWGLFGPVVIVDALGARFAREDVPGAAATACFTGERGYWWSIFDHQLTDGGQSRSIAEVTSKNAKRLVGPCEKLDELAEAMGLPADALKATFARYDALAKAGKDDDFGRTLHLAKLEGPYYALKQFPVRYKTHGGAKTDEAGRLQSAAGTVIPNVYCCGSVAAGSAEGLASNGAFGMLVGQAVVEALSNQDVE